MPPSDLEPMLADTLRAVAIVMAPAERPWWIIGSAAVALYAGRRVTVADVDVLLAETDARSIMPRLGIEIGHGPDHPDFRSALFATWHEHPLPIEFMAGFHHRRGARWHAVAPATRERVQVAEGVVFMPARHELHRILESFGRPKDSERARLLHAF